MISHATLFPAAWASAAILGAAAAGMAACIHLFLTLNRKIQTLDRAVAELRAAQKEWVDEARSKNAAVEERLHTEEQRAAIFAPAQPRSGLNLNKRTHVIRLARRGEAVGAIASTLQPPRAEVELLLKVEKLTSEAPETAAVREAAL